MQDVGSLCSQAAGIPKNVFLDVRDKLTKLPLMVRINHATKRHDQDTKEVTQPGFAERIDSPEQATQSAVDSLLVWLQTCEHSHGTACQPEAGAPRFLIDLEHNGQIISTTEHTQYRYIALSYHRQDQNSCNLTAESRLELRDCNSLFQHQLLPPIVHQTMKFVRDIGERYLWVDFLCLAHGTDDVLQEMKRMDKIHAGALFTIITACANGLYENEPESLASDLDSSRSTSPMPPKTKSKAENAMVHHYETLLGSKWAKRGWTFQERMFSKRALVFVPRSSVDAEHQRPAQVQPDGPDVYFFWECECAMWDNWNLKVSPSLTLETSRVASDPKRLIPDVKVDERLHFPRYLETVYHYNNREFTNPQDVLRAVSGCLRRLGEEFTDSFKDGFLCGLPRHKFHESLLWQPLGDATRRQCNCERHHESPHQDLPSWSWCGWKCGLDLQSLHFDQHEQPRRSSRPILPSWGIHNSVDWQPLEKGNMPKHPELSFPSPQDLHQCDWRYLTCQTHTATLHVRAVHAPPNVRRPCARIKLHVKTQTTKFQSPRTRQVVSLEDGEGTWAGVLGLTSDFDATSLPHGREVLLMAISEGNVSYNELKQSYEERKDADACSTHHADPKRNNPLTVHHDINVTYSFFNVLWVEKVDECFSRKAIGRVEASVWRGLCLGRDKTTVVLG